MANWKLLMAAMTVYIVFDWALNGFPYPNVLPW
jgi:hypothetical protein